ncbi:MAG: hypothetical protein FJ161_02995 [Gammaproteobacteria bacterium]|nr:hypothetical protein [Gammaproteobacteria bacterium]
MGFQLSLGLKLGSKTTLKNFFPGLLNHDFFSDLSVKLQNGTPLVQVIYGGSQTGKSHLLKGACHELASHGHQAGYIDLTCVTDLEILKGLEQLKMIAFDHVESIINSEETVQQLKNFIEISIPMRRQILISGRQLPSALNDMPNISYYHLQPLIESDLNDFLKIKSEERGLILPEDIQQLILTKSKNNPNVIVDQLNLIEERCDHEKKKLSLRFARAILTQSDNISV